MNDALLSALIGLGGSIVGAAAALLGTSQSNRHNAREAKAQREQDLKLAHEEDLKAAYIEWMHSLHVRNLSLAKLAVMMNMKHKVDQAATYDEITQDVVFNAARLKLSERQAEIYQLVDDTIQAYYEAVKVVTAVASTPDQRRGATDALVQVGLKAHEAVRKRFTGQPLPARLTKHLSPSKPQPPPEPEPQEP